MYSDISSKILKTYNNNSGYECIDLRNNDQKRIKRLIHRLVALEFCTGYEEDKIVNHIDSDRLNNKASNLEWLTYTESIHEMRDRGALNTHSARKANRKNQVKKVDQYTSDGETYIRTFNSVKEATESLKSGTGNHISTVLRGKRKVAHGYHWKYNNPKDDYSYYKKGYR